MQVILNEEGYVKAYALVGDFGTPSIIVSNPEDLNDFENNYGSYYLSEYNVLVKSDNKQKEIEDKMELVYLRDQREKACFSYVNRGNLWYGKLSECQKEELDAWYQAWLDVTETRVIPEAPSWLC
jgi:hypothetical protein